MNKLLEPPPGIVETVQRYECPRCGNSCSCGIPYTAKTALATKYAAQNPTASVREIAEQTGVGHGTAQEAKARVRTPRKPSPPAATASPIRQQDRQRLGAAAKPSAIPAKPSSTKSSRCSRRSIPPAATKCRTRRTESARPKRARRRKVREHALAQAEGAANDLAAEPSSGGPGPDFRGAALDQAGNWPQVGLGGSLLPRNLRRLAAPACQPRSGFPVLRSSGMAYDPTEE
jgi:hypothetical protein